MVSSSSSFARSRIRSFASDFFTASHSTASSWSPNTTGTRISFARLQFPANSRGVMPFLSSFAIGLSCLCFKNLWVLLEPAKECTPIDPQRASRARGAVFFSVAPEGGVSVSVAHASDERGFVREAKGDEVTPGGACGDHRFPLWLARQPAIFIDQG